MCERIDQKSDRFGVVMRSSPATSIIVGSGGGVTNYTTITSSLQQQQQSITPSNGGGGSVFRHELMNPGGVVLAGRDNNMMIINCSDNNNNINNNRHVVRRSSTMSITPVQNQDQEQHHPSSQNSSPQSPPGSTTTTILLPIQVSDSSGYDQNRNMGERSLNNINNNQPIEQIIILNTPPTMEQYGHGNQGNIRSTGTTIQGTPTSTANYEQRIIMISPSTATKLEAGQVQASSDQQMRFCSPEKSMNVSGSHPATIISVVSAPPGVKDSELHYAFDNGSGSGDMGEGKITTTTTREGNSKESDCLELDADGEDVFKFVLDEVAGAETKPMTRVLRSSGIKDPMMGSGGGSVTEILMMSIPESNRTESPDKAQGSFIVVDEGKDGKDKIEGKSDDI